MVREEGQGVRIVKMILVFAGLLVLLIYASVYFPKAPEISAQGISSLDVVPDEVSVNLLVETRNDDKQKAQEETIEIGEEVKRSLNRIGIEGDDIRFLRFSVYEEYDWDEGVRTSIGYVARQEIVVKSKNFDEIFEIVESGVDSGATVSYINFELSSELQNEYKVKALELASEDARKKADAIASGQGKEVGRLVSLSNQDFNYGGPVRYFESSAQALPGGIDDGIRAPEPEEFKSVNPEDVKVSASVSVRYKLSRF